ncbi:MAG: hypothetical protein ACI9Y1_001748 [Lentisphaeria bacterium]|jgi:hypothetical protein
MRWIFFTLLLVNLLTFAWGLVVVSSEPVLPPSKAVADPFKGVPALFMLTDPREGLSGDSIPPMALVAKNSTERLGHDVRNPESVRDGGEGEVQNSSLLAAVPAEERQAKLDTRALCDLVGPFEDHDIAKDFVERLGAIEVASIVTDIELPAGPGYWVYLVPEATRKDSLRRLSELQARGIDSYVIPKGELANGISLGMFSKKALAEARVKEMQSIGLIVNVDEIERSYREIWVVLDWGEGAKMSELTWKRVMEGIKLLERRQNYCLDVAS